MRNPVVVWAEDVLGSLGFFDEEDSPPAHENDTPGYLSTFARCTCGWLGRATTDTGKSWHAHVRRVT